MGTWLRRHQLLGFAVLAYAISWSVGIPLALQAQGVADLRLPWAAHYLTAFGPALAALLISAIAREPLAGRPRPPGLPSIGWLAVGFASPLLLFLTAQLAARIVGQPAPDWQSLGQVNFLPPLGLLAWVLWFATSGIGEEVGWRGYALPRLQRTHSALRSSVLLAFIWTGWHAPAFFYLPSYLTIGLWVLPGFFLGILCGSVVLTWLFNSSRGSVLSVVLWHASFNFVSGSPNAAGTVAAIVSTLVMIWAVVIVWRLDATTLTRARRNTRLAQSERLVHS